MRHQQRDFVRPPDNPIDDDAAAGRKSIFATIVNALHESRRLQADRVLRRYDHLIARHKERIAHQLDRSSGGRERLVSGRSAQAKPAQLPAPGEMGWLVTAAVAFLVIHVVAGTILLRDSANAEAISRPEPASSQYD